MLLHYHLIWLSLMLILQTHRRLTPCLRKRVLQFSHIKRVLTLPGTVQTVTSSVLMSVIQICLQNRKKKSDYFLNKNSDVFSDSLQSIDKTDLFKHKIETILCAKPVSQRFCCQDPVKKAVTEEKTNSFFRSWYCTTVNFNLELSCCFS